MARIPAEKNSTYILGMIFFAIGLLIIGLALYLLPHLLFRWRYDVPEFVAYLSQWMQARHLVTERIATFLIFLLFIAFAFLAFFIALKATQNIENSSSVRELPEEERPARAPDEPNETANILVKIVLIVLLVFLAMIIFEWLLYIPPPQP